MQIKTLFLGMGLILAGFNLSAQNKVNEHLATAKSQYAAKNLEDTRFALQQALTEVDIMIGKLILEKMPAQWSDMKAIIDKDEHVGSSQGFAGVYVFRNYESSAEPKKTAEITLINDSPLLAGVNAFLSMPMAVALSGRKTIKVDGYKGMLERVENAQPTEYNINFPFGQSLLSFRFQGIDDENTIIKLVDEIPVGEIIKLAN
ncbi:MAG: hypothetical protein HC880_06875 [Bacteroidia bacterium]|nr:hypothetical protein [Bacteroidia bacterium]